MAESNVVPLRPTDNAAKQIEFWRGVLRFMGANGRTKIEIGIEDVREICRLYEEVARAESR